MNARRDFGDENQVPRTDLNIIDFHELPPPAKLKNPVKTPNAAFDYFSESMSSGRTSEDLLRLWRDVESHKPIGFSITTGELFYARVQGVTQAISEVDINDSNTVFRNMIKILGPNLSNGSPHHIDLEISQEGRVFHTFTSGFVAQKEPATFTRRFSQRSDCLNLSSALLHTMSHMEKSKCPVRIQNVSETLDLIQNNPRVGSLFSESPVYSDGLGHLSADGVILASTLRRPHRMREWTILSEEERALDGVKRAGRILKDYEDVRQTAREAQFIIHQGTNKMDVFKPDASHPPFDNYVHGSLKDGVIRLNVQDLGWCRKEEALRGAINTLSKNGFADNMPVDVFIFEGEWKRLTRHTIEEYKTMEILTRDLSVRASRTDLIEHNPYRHDRH